MKYMTANGKRVKKMEGSLGAMFVFVFIICVAIIALILALESQSPFSEEVNGKSMRI